MSRSSSHEEVHAFHPLLIEAQYRVLWSIEKLRHEAVAAGHGGPLLELLWETVQRDPLHAPAEWVRLIRSRAERTGARRLGQIAEHCEALLGNVEAMVRGRTDAPDRIQRSSHLLELLERRCSERVSVELPVEWMLRGAHLGGICRNLSEGGFLAELDSELCIGVIAPVVLGLDPPLGPIRVRARVVWAGTSASGERSVIGAEFVQTSREALNRVRLFTQRLATRDSESS